MKRLFVVVEGDSEERFVRGTLRDHLPGLDPVAIKVETSRGADGRIRHGGGDWTKWCADIQRTLRSPGDRIVTTMFDLYGLPKDFPERGTESRFANTSEYATALESAMAKAIGDKRFVPNLVRHEFETLVLAALSELERDLAPAERARLAPLREALEEAGPEEINCGNTTAPSKRLQQAKVNYGKLTRGVPAVHAAGIAKLCTACPRFRTWIRKLEKL